MAKLTTHERMTRMFEHREADRVPILDIPWETTVERWHREGMPESVKFSDYFDLDHRGHIFCDHSPRYPMETVEETSEYRTYTTDWGVTLKNWKHITSTPEYIDFRIKDWDSWREAKARMVPDDARIPWDMLKRDYKAWREKGYWVQADTSFGFDVTHSWIMGTPQVLMLMAEDPDMLTDMFNHELTVSLTMLDKVWDAGYTFDSLFWCDDMGFKLNQFFSLSMYRELIKPVQKRAIDWAHAKGVRAHLHSCGDIRPFVPELVEIGLDGLNPIEVKAGMEPEKLKAQFGDKLLLHGGVNAVLWEDADAIIAEIERIVPVLKQSGGYIFASDHSIPDAVSFNNIRAIIETVKKAGSYN